MKKFIKKTVQQNKIKSVVCNRCGKEFNLDDDDGSSFNGNLVHEFKIQFHYGSKHDMEKWSFDLCDNCIFDFVNTFKVSQEIEEVHVLI